MSEEELSELWDRLYQWLDEGVDYGLCPDEISNKVLQLIREIVGEQ